MADAMRWNLLEDYACAPRLRWFEVRGALLRAERRLRTDAAPVALFLKWLTAVLVRLTARPADEVRFGLARQHDLSIYDATYLELGRRLELPLATLDRRLAKAARAAGGELL